MYAVYGCTGTKSAHNLYRYTRNIDSDWEIYCCILAFRAPRVWGTMKPIEKLIHPEFQKEHRGHPPGLEIICDDLGLCKGSRRDTRTARRGSRGCPVCIVGDQRETLTKRAEGHPFPLRKASHDAWWISIVWESYFESTHTYCKVNNPHYKINIPACTSMRFRMYCVEASFWPWTEGRKNHVDPGVISSAYVGIHGSAYGLRAGSGTPECTLLSCNTSLLVPRVSIEAAESGDNYLLM